MNTTSTRALLVLAGLTATAVSAGEMQHGFTNPSFGGSPLNGSTLLSEASAQNGHKPPRTASPSNSTTATRKTTTPTITAAERFQQMVDNLVLSSLATRIVDKAFGRTDLPESSTINTGLNTVSVQATVGGTTVTIVDNKTGGKSVITIPSF